MKKIISVLVITITIALFTGCTSVNYSTEKQEVNGTVVNIYKYNNGLYNMLYTVIIRVESVDGSSEIYTFQQTGSPPQEWNIQEGQTISLEKTIIYQNGSIYQVWYDWTNQSSLTFARLLYHKHFGFVNSHFNQK